MNGTNDKLLHLNGSRAYVLDGGFGSLLERLGYPVEKHILWSGGALLDRPDLVEKVHEEFIDAGAEIIETNTYHVSIQKLIDDKCYSQEEGEQQAVRNALTSIKRRSVSKEALVGAVGPYATYLRDGSEYTGAYVDKPDFNEKVVIDYYRLQTKPLIEAGVKHLLFETIPSLVEVKCALDVLDSLPQFVRGWIVVSCQDALRTRHGEAFADVVKLAAAHPKVTVVGINCTSPLDITGLLESAAGKNNGKPFVVYPNSGEIYNPQTGRFEGDTKVDLIVDSIPTWYSLGARIFGGCCRVFPEHIRRIADACQALNAKLSVN
ncbi:putative homocysteine S-methyltransferase [Aphelenchoides avenae]|nr:putative homocysteine S-methyltransferase [Aphelenchus avenae]